MSKGLGIAAVVGLVVLVRLAVLAAFGPVETPDSNRYIQQAECLLDRPGATFDVCREATFKSAGYGFFLAAMMSVFGEGWAWAAVIVQTLLSLLASAFLGRAMLALSGSPPLALAAFAMHNLAMPLNIDLWLLRDSLFASLVTIALSDCLWRALERQRPRLAAALLIGVLFGIASTLREQLLYYGVVFLPLLLLTVRPERAGRSHAILALIALVAPTLLFQQGLRAWNASQWGVQAVSTNARTVMSQAVLEVAQKNPDLYDGGTALDKAARAHLVEYAYGEVVRMNQALRSAGLSDAEISRMAIDKYRQAWQRYPLAMLQVVLARFFNKTPKRAFNPANGILMHKGYMQDSLYFSGTKTLRLGLREGRAWPLALGLFNFLGEAISFALFVLAWASFLVSAARLLRRRGERRDAVIAAAFLCFAGTVLAHAMVHIEPRQVAGLMGIPLLLGLEFAHRLAAARGLVRRPLAAPRA